MSGKPFTDSDPSDAKVQDRRNEYKGIHAIVSVSGPNFK